MNRQVLSAALAIVTSVFFISACSKKGSPADPCAAKTISLTATTADAAAGASNGSITVTAAGSTGFTYSINGGSFVSSNVFSNLAPGSYTLIAKDGEGCTGQASFTVNAADACAGKNIVFAPVTVAADKCVNDGQLTVTVTGSTGFQYKLDGGAYQASNLFGNVAAGPHTVFAKDAAGCEKNTAVTVAEKPAGPLFTAVKAVITARCVGCHNTTTANGGANFDSDCGIVSKGNRIKVRAVDQGTMPQGGPQLAQADKDKITNWINAGGKHSN